ncbi:MAG: hypothetical protein IJZ82_06945 [Lachnospiraceae bacterium]|nr:hypothetical protein [Lachnospiraceae bacterium]
MKKFLLLIAGAFLAGSLIMGAKNSMSAKALSPEHQQWLDAAAAELQAELSGDPIMAVVYKAEQYPLYNQPGQQGELLLTLGSGTTVYIQDVTMTESAEYQAGFDTWYQVSAWQNGAEYIGYINRAHLAISDEDFLQWEINFGTNPAMYEMMLLTEETAIDYSDVEQFPESYQPYLRALKEKYPKWIFVPQNTALDWDYVIGEELKGERSLIATSQGGHMYDNVHSPGWGFASEEALEYYMDPRNGLTEERIFQFEQLTYNASYHTQEALDIFLDTTFMGNGVLMPENTITYSLGIWAIGANAVNVSPFHLAARIYQEQGKGNSPLISGTYPGFEGYYNFFNVKASGKTNEEIYVNGLTYAKQQDWHDGYFSIWGGAKLLAQNYIGKGQDTLYLQKYNVIGSHYALFTHQYMQNIMAPTSEGRSTYKLYNGSNSLNNAFVFKIPVYENMPETACELTTSATRVALEIPEGYSEAVIHVDGVEYPAEKRNGQFIAEIGHADGKAAVLYSYNEKGVPTGMKVWMLDYTQDKKGTYYKATLAEEFTDALLYEGFSIRITGKSGMRMKASVPTALKETLLSTEGVLGYRLKEYGNLLMTASNYPTYPMTKESEKTAENAAYILNSDGTLTDNVFQTEDGRTFFTTVLVGIPASYYKTSYAFRSYMTLENAGEEITLYGPIQIRHIYYLAQRLLEAGNLQEGSAQQLFLKQLIADGDAAELEKQQQESEAQENVEQPSEQESVNQDSTDES